LDIESEEIAEDFLYLSLFKEEKQKRESMKKELRYLWETYRLIFELMKFNKKLEDIYVDTVKTSFEFCVKYNRRQEMKRLIENLRQTLV